MLALRILKGLCGGSRVQNDDTSKPIVTVSPKDMLSANGVAARRLSKRYSFGTVSGHMITSPSRRMPAVRVRCRTMFEAGPNPTPHLRASRRLSPAARPELPWSPGGMEGS